MEAVKSNSMYEQRWPVDSKNPEVVQPASATQVWNALIESAHASAEPGVLFWDTAKNMTPSDIYSGVGFGSCSCVVSDCGFSVVCGFVSSIVGSGCVCVCCGLIVWFLVVG